MSGSLLLEGSKAGVDGLVEHLRPDADVLKGGELTLDVVLKGSLVFGCCGMDELSGTIEEFTLGIGELPRTVHPHESEVGDAHHQPLEGVVDAVGMQGNRTSRAWFSRLRGGAGGRWWRCHAVACRQRDLLLRGARSNPVGDVEAVRSGQVLPGGGIRFCQQPAAALVSSGDIMRVLDALLVTVGADHDAIRGKQPTITVELELACATDGRDGSQPDGLQGIDALLPLDPEHERSRVVCQCLLRLLPAVGAGRGE